MNIWYFLIGKKGADSIQTSYTPCQPHSPSPNITCAPYVSNITWKFNNYKTECFVDETVWLRGNSHLFNGGRSPNWTPLLPEWCEQRDKNANLCTPSLPKRAPTEWSSIIITTILQPVQGFHNMSANSDMLLCLIIRKILSRACFYNTIHNWLLIDC